jgi:hypothetical protein
MKNTFVATLIMLAAGLTVNDIASAQQRDYLQIYNLANIAMDKCHQDKDIEECDKLNRIGNTLMRWCAAKDAQACELLSYLQSMEGLNRAKNSI